jgi:N-acetylglucosamine kinase-like BadF-type ATPase
LPVFNCPDIEKVWFYGAGCAGRAMEKKVRDAIGSLLPSSEVFVYSDLIGAARSLLGTEEGFVCMLGTGSNSGYYDGNTIVANVPPLGFILGDEGSGAYLGKRVLADFIRGIMPPDLSEFQNSGKALKKKILWSCLQEFPNRFIGGFVQF